MTNFDFRRLRRTVRPALFLLLFWSFAAQAQWPLELYENGRPTIAPLLEDVTPAVVNIGVTGRQSMQRNPMFDDPFFRRFFNFPEQGPSRPRQSVGSGVIIDARQGYVLTNHHVIANAEEITVTLQDRRRFDAKLIGSDEGTDIALLKIDGNNLTALALGDSTSLRVGDFVVAIGNPFGLGQTVTSGIVSALGRSGLNVEGYEDFIQTDASINPGNSGGALVNMRGELVGINSAIISRSGGNVGIGFAVPSELARSIMRQILDFGEVRRGLLGVSIQTIDAESAKALGAEVDSGALVSAVEPGSAAEKAGIQVDDIIVRVDDEKIDNSRELANAIGLKGSGEKVQIEFVRDGRSRVVAAELGQQEVSRSAGGDVHPGLEGAQFASTSTTATRGVEVTEVEPGSPAAQRGLRSGDVITAVNRQPVQNLGELREIAAENNILFLLVQRGDRALMLQIR